MKKRLISQLACLASLVVAASSFAQEGTHQLKTDISALLVPEQLFGMTPETLEQKYSAEGFRTSPFFVWNDAKTEAEFSTRPYSNIQVALTAFNGTLPLMEATVHFSGGKAVRCAIQAESTQGEVQAAKVKSTLSTALGGEPPSQTDGRVCGLKTELGLQSLSWSTPKASAMIEHGPSFISAQMGAPGVTLAPVPIQLRAQDESDSRALEFFVRLDPLLRPDSLWNLTPATLEETIPKPRQLSKSPYFEWTSAERDGARFSKKIFNNTSTDILLFGDLVKAEEAVIQFREGKAVRVDVSILNRGDSGAITDTTFQDYYKAAGRALGTMLGVAPRSHKVQSTGSSVVGWLWTTPTTVAVLEYNPEALAPKSPQVEFLRLKMAPANQWSSLVNVAGIGGIRSKQSLLGSVTRDRSTGEVMLKGVPMVDQGQKGYCVAATCQRVFNYMGIRCDQHELASLLATDAEEGTNIGKMYEALTKVDAKFNTRFKAVKANKPFKTMTQTEYERFQKPDFMKTVRDYINAGTPVIWALDLGEAPPDPNLPQQGGGHMRLIIGYNDTTNQIIYTDSWGAGHEKKLMTANAANRATDVLFVMEPQR